MKMESRSTKKKRYRVTRELEDLVHLQMHESVVTVVTQPPKLNLQYEVSYSLGLSK